MQARPTPQIGESMPASTSALVSLVELTKGVIAEVKSIGAGQWDPATAERCAADLERLVDSAANLELPPLQEPALDLYAYVGVFTEGALTPNEPQRLELMRLCAELNRGLIAAAPELIPATSAAVYALSLKLQPSDELSERFAQEGFQLCWFTDADSFQDALKRELPKAAIAEASLIQAVGELLDRVAESDPEPSHVPLIAVSGNADRGSRLRALVGGADLFVPALADPSLPRQVKELIQAQHNDPFRVLIVDDDRSTADYCAHILHRAGMRIRTVLEAVRVVSAVREFNPDLVLMDLYMPVQDGMSLTMELRQQADALVLPIVFLSGEQSEDARFQAIQAGGDDFLTKPIRPRHLIAAVRSRIKRIRALGRQVSSLAPPQSGGQVRRGSFLARLGECLQLPPTDGVTVLCALAVDQAAQLDDDLGLASKYAIEQALARRLLQQCGPSDVLCLWQEFGFGLLLRNCPRQRVTELTQQLRKEIAAHPLKIRNEDSKVTISIGIAPQPRAGSVGVDAWISSAFAALGTAQRLGGNRIEGLLSDDDELPPERVLWMQELLKMAANGSGVGTEFQPLVPLRGQEPGHYALMQYLRDRRQPLSGVPRSDYLRVARDLKVVSQIERIGLFRALEALDDQRSRNHTADVLVPLDLTSTDRSLLDWLERELKRRHYQGQSLSVEFDAATLLERPALVGVIKRLRQTGVKVLLADRSGQLQRLQSYRPLPLDGLRIPVSTLLAAPMDSVNQMIEEWREPGKILIADGINEVSLLANLWSLGVDYLQGTAVAAPGPRLDFDFSEINV